LFKDRAGGIADVDLATAKLLKAPTGPCNTNRDFDLALFSFWNSSAIASVIGNTVLEPST
jgi:hypothetical protein